MTKKTKIILIIIFLGIGVGALVWFGRSGNTPSDNTQGKVETLTNDNPLASLAPPGIISFSNEPQGNSFVLGTPKGSVTVNNFYKLPLVVDEEFLILADTNDYQITYDTENDQFFIYASSTPLDAARQAGEMAFLQLLNISQSDACKLNVLEGYPQASPLANDQPGLSFCTGGAFQ